MEARSTNQSQKQEVLVKAGILDINATVYCKCQKHNSISKELSRGSYIFMQN